MGLYVADLHVHSRFARGCSKELSVANLAKWATVKGVDVLGTGDFTHPEWVAELRAMLVREEEGIYYTRDGQAFILSTEVSLVYSQGGRGRRVHVCLLAPSFAVVGKITGYLLGHGRVDYDGRPIFKISARDFVKEVSAIDERVELFPAHVWTPWYAVFGSKSGFDSLQEAFGDQAGKIHVIETGLSSDVEMNDRLSSLEGVRYVSFSDAHSFWPWRLGREATMFDFERLTYDNVLAALRTGKGLHGTIEVEPSYGKYHADGHRACNVLMTPSESTRVKGLCPVCGKPLTIGVWNRVEELADKAFPKPGLASQRSYKLLPLHEILSFVLGKGLNTKTVWDAYWNVLKAGKHEYDILLNVSRERLLEYTSPTIADAVIAVREGNVSYTPGYDGLYGVPTIEGVGVATREKKRPLPRRIGSSPVQQGLGAFTGGRS